MSFFGGDSSTRSTSESEFHATPKPYAPTRRALNRIGRGLGGMVDTPLNYFEGDRLAGFDPRSLQAFQGMEGVSDVFGMAPANELASTIGGSYLPGGANENPFLQQSIDYATAPILEQLNTRTLPGIQDAYAMAGRTGMSPSAMQRMGQEYRAALDRVGGLGATMAGNAYENERNRQMQAMGLMGQAYLPEQMRRTVGSEFEAQRQAEINDQMQQFYEAEREPFERYGMISNLALPIGAAFPEQDTFQRATTDTTASSGGGLFSDIAGGLGLGLVGTQLAGNLGAFGGFGPFAGSGGTTLGMGYAGAYPGGYMGVS